MKKVHFDIETIPSQLEWVREYYSEKVSPPKTIKKAESIEKLMQEDRPQAIEDALDKAGFSGASNHIITIAWAVDDSEIKALQIGADISQEKEALKEFFADIEKLPMGACFCGHNIIGFDIKIIKQRAMVLGVKIPRIFPIDAKPWDNCVYDTMLKWDSRDFVKMDLIARAFGIQGKGAVDGSMVYPMWQEGRYDEIKEYCIDDVRMGRAVYEKMAFLV